LHPVVHNPDVQGDRTRRRFRVQARRFAQAIVLAPHQRQRVGPELADVLAAPPRRRIDRRYSVEEFERSPEARETMARIEIDTVNFGFGEGFLREEEIDKLDRIAVVLEKVLAKNPDEVFLLEGHTDAVGSTAANLALSRQRGQAV
jgi:outer membrane protein OmpA-like peptidoglycan-associated protein